MYNIIQKIDINILKFIYNLQNKNINNFMITMTHLGDFGLIWILVSILLIFHKKKVGIISLYSLVICFFNVNILLKPIFHRIRPFNLINDFQLLLNPPKDFSFPSGHTAASFVMVYIFYKHLKNYYFFILILAILISFSRLYLTVHYPSDVFFGILIGLFSGYLGDKFGEHRK